MNTVHPEVTAGIARNWPMIDDAARASRQILENDGVDCEMNFHDVLPENRNAVIAGLVGLLHQNHPNVILDVDHVPTTDDPITVNIGMVPEQKRISLLAELKRLMDEKKT